MHPIVHLSDEAQVETCFCPFEDSANLDVRWRAICAEHTIGLEIVLDAPYGTPR
jgi:hypothetical protein